MLHPARLLRAAGLSVVRPFHVAYVQALAPRSLTRRLTEYDAVLFMTDRAVPLSTRRPYVIDFIDDLGGAAALRAGSSRSLPSVFWRWEGRRLRRLDAKLASRSLMSVAVNTMDAKAISERVETIPPAIGTRVMPELGTRIVFTGNLFFGPNLEAATWICESLTPRLQALGVDPRRILIAGRRPPGSLRGHAAAAGVELRADVPDLTDVLREAAVVIVPVTLGSGVQNKVLDAVGAGRPCILTPFTNQVLGLVDGRSALIRERTADAFAEAVLSLLGDPSLGQRLASSALQQFDSYTEEAVLDEWRQSFVRVRQALESHGPSTPDGSWTPTPSSDVS